MLIMFVATVFRSAFGFGEAIIAVPLLALCIPVREAAPLTVLVSVVIAAVIVVQDWKQVQARSAGWLVFSSLFGIPLGLLLLTLGGDGMVKAVLAVFIMGFSAYSLLGRTPPALSTNSWRWLAGCGFVAGVLGGAFGMNGPPLVIYGAMRRWSAQHFRATLQGYFLPASLVGLGGFWLAGLWVAAVTHYFLWSLLVLLPAIQVGRLVNRWLPQESFVNYIYLGLIGMGAVLFLQAIRQ
jgi:uncharacterized protein